MTHTDAEIALLSMGLTLAGAAWMFYAMRLMSKLALGRDAAALYLFEISEAGKSMLVQGALPSRSLLDFYGNILTVIDLQSHTNDGRILSLRAPVAGCHLGHALDRLRESAVTLTEDESSTPWMTKHFTGLLNDRFITGDPLMLDLITAMRSMRVISQKYGNEMNLKRIDAQTDSDSAN